jgi:hypothetical protein
MTTGTKQGDRRLRREQSTRVVADSGFDTRRWVDEEERKRDGERRQLETERIRALGTRRLVEDASRIVNLPFYEREAGLIYTCKKSVLLGVEPISNLSTKKWRAAFWGEAISKSGRF